MDEALLYNSLDPAKKVEVDAWPNNHFDRHSVATVGDRIART